MQTQYLTHHSDVLDRDMHMMIYGHVGAPFLAFPTQDALCREYEEFGLIEQIADFIEDGRAQVFVVDTVDRESWSKKDGDPAARARMQERYFHYIVDEAVPLIKELNPGPLRTMGLSMGADHAAITFLRRPDLFAGMLALSGVYDADYFFGGYMDPTLYDNSPERFLPNMPADHPYIALYNQKKIIFCVGQGAWEGDGVRTLKFLQSVFEQKGIRAWCDFWGYDVNHDWPWWFKQLRYFLPFMLDDDKGV